MRGSLRHGVSQGMGKAHHSIPAVRIAAPRTQHTVCNVLQTTEAEAPVEAPPAKPLPEGRLARLRASKHGAQPVKEQAKPIAEYMALPASQYSVLDARMIERISDSTFRCYVGKLQMFGWSAEPVLTVSVTVEQGGCTIRLLSCEIKGSPLVEDINKKFTAQMVNEVRWRVRDSTPAQQADDADKEIVSNTSLEVVLQIPRWCGFLSTASVEDVGSKVLQNVLNIMVPRFLAQLQQDYARWASGDASRKPISSE